MMKPVREPGDRRPACIVGPAPTPRLDPRPMPALMYACPTMHDGSEQRYHKPLWRHYEKLEHE